MRQGLISFTKHKRPISSEDLEVLYAANQLGLNAPESFANSAWFNNILYFGKGGRESQSEMKPGDLQLKTTTSRLKYFISSGGGQGGQNLPPPVHYSPASRTFNSRLPPFTVLLPPPVNWQSRIIIIIFI